MELAVIGSGVTGLSAAWMLHHEHNVTVFEANDYIGGHTNTLMVGEQPVDTGFIVYNEPNYPRLKAMLKALNVPTQDSDMSFGVSIDEGRVEWAGDNLFTMFAQKSNLVSSAHWRMIKDILRFNRQGKALLDSGKLPDESLGAYLDANNYGDEFRGRYLAPMAAAIWSAPTATMLDFPVASFLQFFNNHGLLNVADRPQWKTVTGGSHQYVKKIMAVLGERVQLNNAITYARRSDDGVWLKPKQGEEQRFDQVIFACHADQALALLADANASEKRLLGVFGFQDNRALLHSDPALMPKRRSVWSSWNYLADNDQLDEQKVSVSYWMNRLQSIPGERQYFVSLNPLREPAPEHLIAEINYAHPVFDQAAVAAQSQLDDIQGQQGCWFAGAWCGYGFHEDGLTAAEHVVKGLGVTPPWAQ